MSRGLRALARTKDFMSQNCKHWKQDIGYIEQELKALEIIKNKKVYMTRLMVMESVEDYNKLYNDKFSLTKEEFDLLKEVLE